MCFRVASKGERERDPDRMGFCVVARPGSPVRVQNGGMTQGNAEQGRQNLLQGDFGESWLEVVASAAGLLHGRPYRLDLQKTDVQIANPGDDVTDETTVQVQVKTQVGFTAHEDGTASFRLELADYEELRRIHHIRKLLEVIWLEREGDRVVVDGVGTMLIGRGAWMSLEDLVAKPNRIA
jgi:hypothetical protein